MLKNKKSIQRTRLDFEMKTGWARITNHLRRGKGHLLPYLWNRFQWEYFPRMNIVPRFPLNVDIESSSKCNIKCKHCFRQYMDIEESAFMPFGLYKKIVDECARYGLFTLKFSMRGEPTMHPDIVEMVEYAKKKGVYEVWLNTNGSLLTEKMAEGFTNAGLDCMTVSFDGLRENYENVRIPLKYDDTLSRLKMFMDVRKRLKSKKPLVRVQSIWSAIKDGPDEYLDIMEKIVDKVAFIINLDYEKVHFVPDPNYVCYRLWQRIGITSDGSVIKCPSDFEKEEVLGNAKDISIKEIWDKKQLEERQKHLEGERLQSAVCRKCHHGAKVVKGVREFSGKVQQVDEILYV